MKMPRHASPYVHTRARISSSPWLLEMIQLLTRAACRNASVMTSAKQSSFTITRTCLRASCPMVGPELFIVASLFVFCRDILLAFQGCFHIRECILEGDDPLAEAGDL